MSIAEAFLISFQESLDVLVDGAVSFIPRFVIAVVAFILLWIVAVMLGRLVEQIIASLKLDSVLEGLGAGEPLSRAGYRLNSAAFLGGLVRWFFIVFAFLVAVDILGLQVVSSFLSEIVSDFLPRVIVASLIIVVGAVLGGAAQKVVRGSAQAANMPSASFIGAVAKWAVWIFALIEALETLDILSEFALAFFTGVIAMLALAGGLAFGLGGRDAAAQYIEKLKREMKD